MISKITRYLSFYILIIFLTVPCVYAEDGTQSITPNMSSVKSDTETVEITDSELQKSMEDVNGILDSIGAFVTPDENLGNQAKKILEENEDHWLVRFFKSIIDAISKFINSVFELATQAAKVGK